MSINRNRARKHSSSSASGSTFRIADVSHEFMQMVEQGHQRKEARRERIRKARAEREKRVLAREVLNKEKVRHHQPSRRDKQVGRLRSDGADQHGACRSLSRAEISKLYGV